MPTREIVSSGEGRIVTFYSFKGGVGRTMALANVAFIAAMNGKRVLVMDWDLEAPGLQYYFRGMQEGAAARVIRSARGVLDLVWEWSRSLHDARSAEDAEAIARRYDEGHPFAELVGTLLPDYGIPGDGRVDYIGAGAPVVNVPEPVGYEDALARFDWSSFFAEEAGGVMLDALRRWAKREYDYVFLDSRTGFADVAGICTMQLPDLVALCFVYNRQNIDGIAQVAGAIRDRRQDVRLRAVPMRVARENTSEEADARARARKELIRKGGFTSEAVEQDQKQLAIAASPNVPFYETIALIASDRLRGDQLALDYLNLAAQLLDEPFSMPELAPGWVEAVRRRLRPRSAAPDYVLSLKSKEPERAAEEIAQLLEGAIEDGVDSEEDDAYVEALIATASSVARDGDFSFDTEQVLGLSLDLLRGLAEARPARWRAALGDFLEFYLEHLSASLGPEEELLILEEVDALLALQPGTAPKLKRLSNRRRAARIQLVQGTIDAARSIIADLTRLTAELAKDELTGDARAELAAAEMDVAVLRGDLAQLQQRPETARQQFERGLAVVLPDDVQARSELVRLRFELHSRLARLPESAIEAEPAARHAVAALDWTGGFNAYVTQFVDLGSAVLRARSPGLAADFLCKALGGPERRHSQFGVFYGRDRRLAERFILFTSRMLELLALDGAEGRDASILLLQTLLSILERAVTRRYPGKRRLLDLDDAIDRLLEALDDVGDLPSEIENQLTRLRHQLNAEAAGGPSD